MGTVSGETLLQLTFLMTIFPSLLCDMTGNHDIAGNTLLLIKKWLVPSSSHLFLGAVAQVELVDQSQNTTVHTHTLLSRN